MLDLTKITNAVSAVAGLAKRVADAESALIQAQTDIDALADQLIAAAGSPAESAGLDAVASALSAGLTAVSAPVAPAVAPAVVPPVVAK